jgi:hypothetical protein
MYRIPIGTECLVSHGKFQTPILRISKKRIYFSDNQLKGSKRFNTGIPILGTGTCLSISINEHYNGPMANRIYYIVVRLVDLVHYKSYWSDESQWKLYEPKSIR